MTKSKGYLITGKMYSGKTLSADIIMDLIGAKKYSMARALKQMAADQYNDGVYLSKAESYPVYNKKTANWEMKNGRDILVQLGEAIKHGVDYSWFYVAEANHVKKTLEQDNIFVIDDNRFEEEYTYFKDQFDVTLIYMEAEEAVRKCRALKRDNIIPTDSQLNSPTEQVAWAENYYDYKIINNGIDQDELKKCLELVISGHKDSILVC